MKRKSLLSVLCCLAVAMASAKAADKTEAKPKTKGAAGAPAGDHAADEKVLRKLADDFVKAFNDHDAQAIADQFAPRAEMVDLDGNVVQGRQAIQEFYDKHFEESPFTSAIHVESLRFVGDDLAIEDGHVTFSSEDEKHAQRSHYTVVHAKIDGKWLIVSSRDVINPNDRVPPHEHLKQLAWLVGDWVEEGGDSVVSTTCRWDESKNYLLTDYTVKVAGRTTMSGRQRIGWDPLTKQIKTWTFDGDGGYGEGYWHRDGDRWLVKLVGVAADGRSGSATQIHTPHNDHTRTWSAVDRLLGGERLPDIEEITMVRAPRPRSPAAK
ncbi:MAG TPA: SgcJ/EcaC family oxidoreductase [Pirellulales bacterium]